MKIGIIIQARTNSTRLPNKIILPFNENQNVLEILLKKISDKINIPIVVATSDNPDDSIIEQICSKFNVNCFKGDEHNVLQRFYNCAIEYNFDFVIRICSDNPFIDIEDLEQLINFQNNDDYLSFKIYDIPSIKTHYGFWAERIKTTALERVLNLTKDKLFLEHVTNYIYTYPADFNIKWLENKSISLLNFPIRLTIDTKEDFEIMQNIYSHLKKNNLEMNKINIISHIRDNKTIQKQMLAQIEANSK
jgi:spore coat polysaccharide biosynthesis protein SpsF (cytidylyltransferase family)